MIQTDKSTRPKIFQLSGPPGTGKSCGAMNSADLHNDTLYIDLINVNTGELDVISLVRQKLAKVICNQSTHYLSLFILSLGQLASSSY